MTTIRVATDCLIAFDWALKNLGRDRFTTRTNFHSASIDFTFSETDALVFALAHNGRVIDLNEQTAT